MPTTRRRRALEAGHTRKYLVIVDESSEVEAALYFAAHRISNSNGAHSSGSIILLYVIEPQEFQHWAGVRDMQIEEETTKAKALFRLFRLKLSQAGFQDVISDEVIREGQPHEEILRLIEDDEDVAILILGASVDPKGPGKLVSSLAVGKMVGAFPVPITIVPGNLSLDDLKALA
jgi:nucleotide-binding universal stress UspA family protein